MEPLYRVIPAGKVETHNTALLVIDMERDFVDPGAVQETPGGREIIPAINGLIAWARRYVMPVIFTHEMHRADHSDYGIELEFDPVHCLEGTPGCELTKGLDVRAEDWRIRNKRRYDCFVGTDLDLLLRSRNIKNLVCCGVTTHCCVMSTVYSARNLDYRVIVPTDAVAAVSPAHQDAALLCMSDVFAYLSSTADITSWLVAAGTFDTSKPAQRPHVVA
jgi:nicotinamidase-related amidase